MRSLRDDFLQLSLNVGITGDSMVQPPEAYNGAGSWLEESEDLVSLILAEPMDAGSLGSSSHWLYLPYHFAGGSLNPSPVWSGGSMPPLNNASYGGPSDAGHAGPPSTSGGGYNHAGDLEACLEDLGGHHVVDLVDPVDTGGTDHAAVVIDPTRRV